MKVIVGLGNPGLKYKFTRHNLGFLVVEKLAKASRIEIGRKAFHGLFGEGVFENQEVCLALPLTLMNLSGEAVAAIVKNKKIKLTDLLIVCDDVNLPLGRIRLKPKGSAGGHKGLRSIIEALESDAFARLRLGVDRPRGKAKEADAVSSRRNSPRLSEHVLGNFNKKETQVIDAAIAEAVNAAEVWIKEGIMIAMSRFNRKGD